MEIDINILFQQCKTGNIVELNKIAVESEMCWNYPTEWIDKWKNELTIMEEDFKD